MAEIKINEQNQEQNEDMIRPKITLKAAIRLAEKEEQQLILKISKFHNPTCMRAILNYDQQKSQLQKYLDSSTQQRNKKVLKSIKAELSYLRCFQIKSQEETTPKELLAIMKRDLDMFSAGIAKFVHPQLWPKGSIIEAVARESDRIRVLLRGEVAVFEPVNYKSYKNCMKLYQAQKIRNELIGTMYSCESMMVHFDRDDNVSELLSKLNPEQFEAQDWEDLQNEHKTLKVETAKNLLKKMNIITISTPHRLSYHLKHEGELICSELHPSIIDQEAVYTHTAICLSECYVMELEYEVYKQAIAHLNSDDEKKYMQILLRKFQMMDYFDAKQYIKKQFMIDKKREEAQLKLKKKEGGQQMNEFEKQLMINQGRQSQLIKHSQSDQEQLQEKAKEEPDLQTYPISYDNDLYLIIEGEVTLQIDVIEQTRLSTLEHASKIRQRKPRSILKLYQGDIFGFQEIGKTKEYNLTYQIQKSSKLLLMADETYVRHFSEIIGFREQLKAMQQKRNSLLHQILKNVEKTINQEQIKKYKSISLLERTRANNTPVLQTKKNEYVSLLPSNLVPPRQLQYMGIKQYQKQQKKLRQNVIKQKQSQGRNLSLQKLVKNGVNLKESLPFVSSFKNTLSKNSQIVGNYLEVRDSKGALLRRRSIVSSGRDQAQQTSTFFRKIGIINGEERNNHNMNIILNRKSKYELDEFGQQEKELKRLKKIATSLPKLKNFFSKKQQIRYNIMHKIDCQKQY